MVVYFLRRSLIPRSATDRSPVLMCADRPTSTPLINMTRSVLRARSPNYARPIPPASQTRTSTSASPASSTSLSRLSPSTGTARATAATLRPRSTRMRTRSRTSPPAPSKAAAGTAAARPPASPPTPSSIRCAPSPLHPGPSYPPQLSQAGITSQGLSQQSEPKIQPPPPSDLETSAAEKFKLLVQECGVPAHKISELMQELPPARMSDVLIDYYFSTM